MSLNRKIFFTLLLCLFSLTTSAGASKLPGAELEFQKIMFSKQENKDISGAFFHMGKLWIVADKPEDAFIYEAETVDPSLFDLKPVMPLMKMKGFEEYIEATQKTHPLDLEGLTACNQDFYVINERIREVLKISTGIMEVLKIDFGLHAPLVKNGEANAGWEGIAIDCKRQKLYLAKERDERALFVVDLKTLRADKLPDITGSDRSNQSVIDSFSGQGKMTISPDFSDMFFENNYLYILERNTFEVTKYDLRKGLVVERLSFLKTEVAPGLVIRELYQSGEAFGVAEILLLTKDSIILGTDNNRTPLSGKAEKAFKLQGGFPALIYLKRPKGF